MSLRGKNIVITGASQGIGLKISNALKKEGAKIVSCSRHGDYKCDISKEAEVKEFINYAKTKLGEIDVLINNAGIYGPIGKFDALDLELWKQALEINLYGPIHTMRSIIPIFKEQGYGKIINLSGGGATQPMPNFSSYAATKTALVRLTETIAGELKEFSIDVNSVAPGAFNTRLIQEVVDAGEQLAGKAIYQKSLKQQAGECGDEKKMADLFVWLCSDKSDGLTGKLISAQWDDWKNCESNIDELNSSDIYTLRRVVEDARKL